MLLLGSSEEDFFGSGAKPPKNPQNSPVSASAINFPSSAVKKKISIKHSSTTQLWKTPISGIVTDSCYFTFSIMISIFNVLNNFQSFSPLLNARVRAIKLIYFRLCIKNENVVVVE